MPRKVAEDGPSLAPATSVENSHKDPGPWLQPDSGLATVSIYGGEQANAESSPVTAGASSPHYPLPQLPVILHSK